MSIGSRNTMALSLAAVMGSCLLATGVAAQGLPPGQYRQECRNERIEHGYLLRATCRRDSGEWRDSSLDLRTCPRGASVVNRDAYLHCADGRHGNNDRGWQDHRGGWNGGYALPAGPYRGQCRNERVEAGYLLRATCPKNNGEMRDASLDLRGCGMNPVVYNDSAHLRCR